MGHPAERKEKREKDDPSWDSNHTPSAIRADIVSRYTRRATGRIINEKWVLDTVINGKTFTSLQPVKNPIFPFMSLVINGSSVYNSQQKVSYLFYERQKGL